MVADDCIKTAFKRTNNNDNNNNNLGVMSRPACGTPAFTDFTEHRHSKYPDLFSLINRYGFQ